MSGGGRYLLGGGWPGSQERGVCAHKYLQPFPKDFKGLNKLSWATVHCCKNQHLTALDKKINSTRSRDRVKADFPVLHLLDVLIDGETKTAVDGKPCLRNETLPNKSPLQNLSCSYTQDFDLTQKSLELPSNKPCSAHPSLCHRKYSLENQLAAAGESLVALPRPKPHRVATTNARNCILVKRFHSRLKSATNLSWKNNHRFLCPSEFLGEKLVCWLMPHH